MKTQIIQFVFILFLLFVSCSCSVQINPEGCEINIKQGNTDIPNKTGYFNFGNIPYGANQDISFWVENLGELNLILDGQNPMSISGKNAEDFKIVDQPFFKEIYPEKGTAFKIRFEPLTTGSKSAVVYLKNNDSDENPYSFMIVGTCTPPAPEIHVRQNHSDIICNTGTYDFGLVPSENISNGIIFTIENNGNEILELTGNPSKISIQGTNKSMFRVDETKTSDKISAGYSSQFILYFAPTAPGIKTARISILNTDSDENPYIFTVYGTGTYSPEIAVKLGHYDIPNNTWTHDFGELSTFDTLVVEFIIENKGQGVLFLDGSHDLVEISGTNANMFSAITTNTNKMIKPGDTTKFEIHITPSVRGLIIAEFSISNNDSDEDPFVFKMRGIGRDPEIRVRHTTLEIPNTSGSIDYQHVEVGKSSAEWKFTIENLGAGDLILSSSPIIQLTGSNASEFVIDQTTTVSRLHGGESTEFTVRFAPISSGTKTATVSISNNDLDESPYTFKVNGIGSTYTSGSAIGWIGGGSNGWKTVDGAANGVDYQSLCNPRNLVVDTSGNIYVADRTNHRVCKWDKNGNAIGWIGGGSNGWKTSTAPTVQGRDYQSFYYPEGVFVDSAGYIYVADTMNSRICKWDKDGNAIGWIGCGKTGWVQSTVNYSDCNGNGIFYFHFAFDVYVDNLGYIFVADGQNNRICKWNKNGLPIGWIGHGTDGWKYGSSPSSSDADYKSFNRPIGLCVDNIGAIYIADFYNNRVCKWSSTGYAIGWLGAKSNGWHTTNAQSNGSEYNSFWNPVDVYVSSNGDIYVAENGNNRISKWNASGSAIGWIGAGDVGWKIASAGSFFARDYQSFKQPSSVFIDSSGLIYVCDTSNNRICKYID